MNSPNFVNVPDRIIDNSSVVINWENTDSSYELERNLNNSQNWEPIYQGKGQSFADFIPLNTLYVQYRVRAYKERQESWQSLDSNRYAWEAWSGEYPWKVMEISDYSISNNIRVTSSTYSNFSYYIFRDGINIGMTRGQLEFSDHMTVGLHRYFVQAIDNYGRIINSNTVDIDVPIAYATIASVNDPSNYIELKYKKNDKPTVSNNYNRGFQEVRFISKNFPSFYDSHQYSDEYNIAYTVSGRDEAKKISELLKSGDDIIYRDRFENIIIGKIDTVPLEFEFSGKYDTDVTYVVTIMKSDYSEVKQYD